MISSIKYNSPSMTSLYVKTHLQFIKRRISSRNVLERELKDKINLKLKFSKQISDEERKFFQIKSGFTIDNFDYLNKEGKLSINKQYLDYNINIIYYLKKFEFSKIQHPIITLLISINKIGKKNGIICKSVVDDVSDEVLIEKVDYFDNIKKEMKEINLIGTKKEKEKKFEDFEKFGDLLKNGFDDFIINIGLNKENLKFIKKSAFYEGNKKEIEWLLLFKNVISKDNI